MKVCVIVLVNNGGMTHYASQLCNSLACLENEISVSVIVPDGVNETIFNSKVTLKKIPSIGRHGYRIDLVRKYILEIKPDIIHLTIIHPFIIPILSFLKKMAPLVVTIHDVILHSDQNNFVVSMTTNIISRSANLNFVHSEKLKAELAKKKVLNSKISVVPHGDYSFFDTISDNKIPEEPSTVLFFGRILKYKGIEYLIKAEPLISSKIPNLKIIIAGDGDFTQYQKLISNYSNYEIINEYIPDEKVSELFQKASVIVLPYIEASQTGIVPIAYAFKKPVVTTDVGSLSEVVINGVTGFIVPPKDHIKLADSLTDILLNEDLRDNMGNAAYQFMIKKMSWENVSKKTMGEYLKLRVSTQSSEDNLDRINSIQFNEPILSALQKQKLDYIPHFKK